VIERVFAASNFTFIQQPGNTGGVTTDLPTLVTNIVNILLFVAGALAIIYLIYSGILYISSAGNPDAAKKGQQGVLNAVIGLIIIVLAFFIARAVSSYANTSVNG
jgi:hypothetical protein